MTAEERQFLDLLAGLAPEDRRSLLDYAQFLAARRPAGSAAAPVRPEVPEPQPIPRPDAESVVAALKRLSATYHMLDKSKMLDETSTLVAQHVMQGREAVEVIDELEIIFQRHYERVSSGERGK